LVERVAAGVTRFASRYDLVVDTAGNRTVVSLRILLSPRGRLVIVGGDVTDGSARGKLVITV
jgi:NADPH:quinone reductase-like Zn-dependent oxidoreductase